MTTHTNPTRINAWGTNTIAKQISGPIILGVLLFALAGTTNWFWGWVFNVMHLLVWVGMTAALLAWNPELLNARGKRGAGTKGWDLILLGIYGIAWIALIVVAGLDYRYGWTDVAFSPALLILGNLLMVAGFALTTWGMVVNRNFEVTVRLQENRGHDVITAGPYQMVRHPGYSGVILAFFIGMPLALGSLVAFIPALIGAAVMILRTALEDRTLQAELEGYTEYTQETRYRLLPGIW